MQFLFFGKPKYIGGVQIDAFIEEVHDMTATATRYPVEDGAVITDHVTQNPDALNITGLVSPVSIYLWDITSFNPTRVYDTYLKLTALKEAGDPVAVMTGIKTYQNMIIEGLNITRNKTNGGGLPFTMALTRVKVVKSQFSAIPKNNLGGSETVKQQVKPKVEEPKAPHKTFVQEIRDSGVVKAAIR